MRAFGYSFFLESARFAEATFLKARSNASGPSSASSSRAASINRFDSSGSSCVGFGLRGMSRNIPDARHLSKGSRNWRGSPCRRYPRAGATRLGKSLFLRLCSTRRPIGQPLATDTTQGLVGPPHVIDAKRDALVVAEIELGQIPLNVLLAERLPQVSQVGRATHYM